MKSWVMLGTLAAVLLAAGLAGAAVTSGAEFLSIVDQRVERGEISADEGLLLKFQYCFDRDKLPADLQPVGKAPLKCATDLIIQFNESRSRMPSHITAQIDSYLTPPEDGSRAVYTSPSSLFRINYYTSGENSVPLADGDGDGVPDYVENIADYLDYSFDFECNQLGFQSPPFAAAGGYMLIYLLDLDGIYGYTQIVSSPPGMTRITLENDFVGFPPNDDPDGDQLGAAKVTAAHEFKHSSQYAGSYWSEDGWVEVDAVWMEETAYPQTNDYLNYLSFGSPISDPDVPLDGGSTGTGSYEDCVWQLYMSDKFGSPQIIVDFWEYRKTNRFEPVMVSYETNLLAYGIDLLSAWNEFTMWNFATGIRHLGDESYYHEPDLYPAGSPQHTVFSYPTTDTGFVQHLAANFQRLRNCDSPGDRLRITFDGDDNGRLTLAAVVNESYTTYEGAFYQIPLDLDNDVVYDVPYDLGGVYSIGVIVGNGEKNNESPPPPPSRSYSITVDIVPFDPTAAEGPAPAFAIEGNYPNPFNPSTTIEFALGGTARTTLDVYDLSGRKVNTLIDHVLDAGHHAVVWNGRDADGREVASGTYLAKLRSGDHVTTHKLVMAK